MTSVDRIQGLSGQQAIKTPCRLATTAAITLSGEQTIDGVAAVEGDRVLVKDQADNTTNGVYDVSTGAWTRSLDFDGANDILDGTLVLVGSGSTNADLVFKLNATAPVVLDTTALTFSVSVVFTTISAFAATLLDDADATAARATLGLVIGTNVQAYNATLAALAAQTEAANKIQYYTGDNTPGLLDFKDEDDMASNSATAVPSQQSVKAYVDARPTPIFTASFQSTEQTIAANGLVTVAHGLASSPKFIQCVFKCIDAGGDAGFSQNEQIMASPALNTYNGAGSQADGFVLYFDATNVNVRMGQYLVGTHKTTGAAQSYDFTKWKLIVRAYA